MINPFSVWQANLCSNFALLAIAIFNPKVAKMPVESSISYNSSFMAGFVMLNWDHAKWRLALVTEFHDFEDSSWHRVEKGKPIDMINDLGHWDTLARFADIMAEYC